MGGPTSAGAVQKLKGLNCPGCGAALTLRALEHTLTVVCGQCMAILDAKDPNVQILQKFEAKQRVRPKIPLGSRGKLRGAVYQVIGFQVRTIVVEGVSYSWSEYLLFNPFKGFRYITEYNGHWNDVRTARAIPEPVSGAKPSVELFGDRYVHFQTATAKTTYVMGEFPWRVEVGEAVEAKDFISPPRILSSETTESETVWSLGGYLTGAQVWEMFQLRGNPPTASGVFANQPSPFKGKAKELWRLCLAFLGVLVVLAILFSLFASREEVFRQTYSYVKLPGEGSFVTDIFELKGRSSNVELSIRTNLSNNWAYFNFALINEATGEAYDFGREVSYYFGTDSDGAWSEGSPGDRALIPTVPPGRYYLRVEPELNAGAMNYELELRRDVPSATFFWIAAVLLLIPPVYVLIRALSFERARWQESDYATGSSNGEDDE